jgi:hypothetical protein
MSVAIVLLCVWSVVSAFLCVHLLGKARTAQTDADLIVEDAKRVSRLNSEKAWSDSRKEIEKIRDTADEFADKVATFRYIRDPAYRGHRYAVQVQFDEQMVHEMFQHGNDQRSIEYLGQLIGRHVEREVRQVNFHRLFEENHDRSPRSMSAMVNQLR